VLDQTVATRALPSPKGASWKSRQAEIILRQPVL
jgi:hypothetical protein